MNVTMSMLLDVLLQFAPAIIGEPWPGGEFTAVKMFSASITEYEPTTLYVSTGRELERFYESRHLGRRPPCCVVCVSNAPGEAWKNQMSVILISDSFHFSYVFNCIQELFLDFFQWKSELERIIYTGGTLRELLECGAAKFSNPILIWDATFTIPASATGKPFDCPRLQQMLDQRCFDSDAVKKIISEGLMASRDLHEDRLRILPKESTLCGAPFYIRHFFEEQHRTYSIALVAVNGLPTQGEEDLLCVFYSKVGKYLKKQTAEQGEYHHIYEAFLRKLLDGEITDAGEIKDRAIAFGIPFDVEYLFYTIEFEHFSQPQAEFLIYALRQVLPNEKFIILGERVCLLKTVDAYSCDKEGPRRRFENLLSTYNAYCGLSRVFPNLAGCRDAFRQANAALRLGRQQSRVETPQDGVRHLFRYREYAVFHMLEMCAERVDLLSLLPKRLLRFYLEDRAGGGHDVELLSAFMENGMSVSSTAQAVFLHRNSVAYRIKRIEEQCGMSLSDVDAMMNVLLMLKILRYQKGL